MKYRSNDLTHVKERWFCVQVGREMAVDLEASSRAFAWVLSFSERCRGPVTFLKVLSASQVLPQLQCDGIR